MIILEADYRQVFNTKDTGMSYYNQFLKPELNDYMINNKNRRGEIIMMTPYEYISDCASKIFNLPIDDVTGYRKEEDSTERYANDMRNGDVFPMCVINYADRTQEGLHRMLAAERAFGEDKKYPVLAVYVDDQALEDRANLAYAVDRYRGLSFKRDIWDTLEAMRDSGAVLSEETPSEFEDTFATITNGRCTVEATLEGPLDAPELVVKLKTCARLNAESYNIVERTHIEGYIEIPEEFYDLALQAEMGEIDELFIQDIEW